MDILGPFQPASGQLRFLIVAVDYFTKWVEAEPVCTLTEAYIRRFIWKNLITRFGIPKYVVFGNSRQLDTPKVTNYCVEYGIVTCFTTVAHPQSNGQAESANKIILNGLKRRCEGPMGGRTTKCAMGAENNDEKFSG